MRLHFSTHEKKFIKNREKCQACKRCKTPPAEQLRRAANMEVCTFMSYASLRSLSTA